MSYKMNITLGFLWSDQRNLYKGIFEKVSPSTERKMFIINFHMKKEHSETAGSWE